MPKIFTSATQKTGEIGENVAVKFLVKHGFSVLDRNYTRKWGELDIVAQKDNKVYFIEVKSVIRPDLSHVNHETYRPEDNMHPWKMRRMARTIQTYLLAKKLEDREWQVDLLVVYLNLEGKKAKIKVVKDIILT
ncbi:MAG TPA: YraN family protein [Candidatus Paceibacterota bacterium]